MLVIVILSVISVSLASPMKKADLVAEKAFQNLPDQFKVLGSHGIIRELYELSQEKRDRIKSAALDFAANADREKLISVLSATAPSLEKHIESLQKQFNLGVEGHESEKVKEFATKSVSLGNKAIVELLIGDSSFKDINQGVDTLTSSFSTFTEEEKRDYEQQWPEMAKLFKQISSRRNHKVKDDSDKISERVPAFTLVKKGSGVISLFAHLPSEKKAEVAAVVKEIDSLKEAAVALKDVDSKLSDELSKIGETDEDKVEALEGEAKEFAREVVTSYHNNLLKMLNGEAAFDKKGAKIYQAKFNSLSEESKQNLKDAMPKLVKFFREHSPEVAALSKKDISRLNRQKGRAERTSGKTIEEVEEAFERLPLGIRVKPLHSMLMVVHHLDALTRARVAEAVDGAEKERVTYEELVSKMKEVSPEVFTKLISMKKKVAERVEELDDESKRFVKKLEPVAVSSLVAILTEQKEFSNIEDQIADSKKSFAKLSDDEKQQIRKTIPQIFKALH